MGSRYKAVLCPVAELTLLALHTAISIGATLARIAARNWDLAPVEHAAEQAAAHLIARAVETTGDPDPNPRYTGIDFTRIPVLGIRAHRRADALIIDVWDTDPTPPNSVTLDEHMAAMAVLARRWATYPAQCGGKVIWAEIAGPPHHPAALATVHPLQPQACLAVVANADNAAAYVERPA
jgi:hypothetical protein